MLYNIVLVSTVQQNESAVCKHVFPPSFCASHSGHHRALSFLCYIHSRFSLVIYFIHSINSVYMSIPISQLNLPTHTTHTFPLIVHVFLLYISIFISALQIASFVPSFSRFHIYVLIDNFFFLVFLTFHSV